MKFIKRLWSVRTNDRFKKKVAKLAIEFCLEASVLVTVLGILDSAVQLERRDVPQFVIVSQAGVPSQSALQEVKNDSSHNAPSAKVFGLSLGVGAMLFLTGCIIEANLVVGNEGNPEREEDQ